MTNHVHLLFTPSNSTCISNMMQSLGRIYVLYFNKRYKRSGILWEGRYKSCLVQSEAYLLQLYRYIELNPVRANMVSDPAQYPWSSYQCNALGNQDKLITPHPLYMSLGITSEKRWLAYQALFEHHVEGKLLNDIRQSANKGLALGNEQFINDVEALTGKTVSMGKRGRPIE